MILKGSIMSNLTNELLNIVRSSSDVMVLRSTIDALAAALFDGADSEEAASDTPSRMPVPAVCVAPSAPTTPVEATSVESDDLRADKYREIYGDGNFVLLDDEDKIKEGDEWIIKPECDTNRARLWRSTESVGDEVGDFGRSHFRRAI